MNKEKVFVIGDVHGQITMLNQLLKNWNPAEEQLIFLGDLVDRGENSKATLERVRELMTEHGAIVVKGNHDEMLANFLENPQQYLELYYRNGGESTVNSLLKRITKRQEFSNNVADIKREYPWLLQMLKSLPLYYEWGDYLFVHAGVDMSLDNWQDSSAKDFVWIRESFYGQPNTTQKKILFGHTITANLHNDHSNWNIWQSGDGLYGMDGGVVYGGKLHGVVLSKEELLHHYVVENQGFRF